MKLNTYVNFAGTCAEAFRYYEKHLGAKIGLMRRTGPSARPKPGRSRLKDAVLHAQISLGGTELMAADNPERPADAQRYLTLSVDSDIEAERIFSPFPTAAKS
jgi:PhnB protein